MTSRQLELILFTVDPAFAIDCEHAGVDGFMVDWESKGKSDRQRGHDMEIGTDTPADLARLAAAVTKPINVRINAAGPETASEVDLALANGASGIMLPMARIPNDVIRFLDIVAGRARTIVQIETQSLVNDLATVAALPWDSAYIGLHDLMLSRQASSMWQAILDGTVEEIFMLLAGRQVGFAGATVVGGGMPIPFTRVLQELARLGAALTFLRRSFRREIQDRHVADEIAALRAAWTACSSRGPGAVESDRNSFLEDLRRLV